jgi:lipopolysaccharide transport system permease protein
MTALTLYLRDAWRYRYLAQHLAGADLRARFRGSYVGGIWLLLNPLIFTAIFALVFGVIFGQPLKDYAPYVLLGVVLWELIAGVISMSTQSILSAEGYLKQARIPHIVFCLRTVGYLTVCFLNAFIAVLVVGFALVDGFNPFMALLWLVVLLPVALAFLIPLGVIGAVANTRYRDYQQAIGHLIMALYYVSPVFIPRKEFERPQLQAFTNMNPMTSLLDMFRDTILAGGLPSGHDVMLVLSWAVVLWGIAIIALVKTERDTIFYF